MLKKQDPPLFCDFRTIKVPRIITGRTFNELENFERLRQAGLPIKVPLSQAKSTVSRSYRPQLWSVS